MISRRYQVLAALLCIRGLLLVTLPPLGQWHELQTPMTSARELRECITLWDLGLPVYQRCRHPVVLVLLFGLLPTALLTSPALWLISDVAMTAVLVHSTHALQAQAQRFHIADASWLRWVPELWLALPWTWLSLHAHTTGWWPVICLLAAFSFHQPLLYSLTAALDPTLLPCAWALWWAATPLPATRKTLVRPALYEFLTFLLWTLGPFFLFLLVGFSLRPLAPALLSFDAITALPVAALGFLARDLTPNVGLWWYFFAEIFPPFRHMFLGVFTLQFFISLLPLFIWFRRSPIHLAWLYAVTRAVFKPYPALDDHLLWALLLPLDRQVAQQLVVWPLLAMEAVLFTAMSPVVSTQWLEGSGNSNFFYFSSNVIPAIVFTLLFADYLRVLRTETEKDGTGQWEF